MSSSNNLFSNSTSIDSGIDDLQNPKFNYTGNFDQQGFRDRYGCQTWDRPFRHKYAGYFLYNNMHDRGFYFIKQEDGISFYDGQFYNNKLEGYGQVIHNDGKVHEGLFKDNRKFGPGVLSYPDGTQDVGLWNGNYLIRLSLSVSSDIVPSLCNNPVNKIKLLRFKKIVPALPKRKDLAKDLMSGLTKDESFSQRYPELYNPHVRNEHSLFYDRRLYDLAQLGSEDTYIEVLEDEGFVDGVSEVIDSEDAFCPCTNERCIHITKQISEIESELLRIHHLKKKYEKQQQMCEMCCKASVPSPHTDIPESSSANSSSKTESVEDETHPSGASIVEDANLFSQQGVEKNLDQMRLGISLVEISANADSVPITQEMENMNKTMPNPRKEESISKIFMCAKEFLSDQSSNNSEHETFFNAIEKYACTCTDEEIPDADFLIEQLENLKREEKFYERVLDFLNQVLFKEFSTVKKSGSSKVVKLQVEDLLTWNNGKTAIEILQHSFRYRNFENILSFKIKSIFIGDRTAFGKVGSVEAACINFLKHCVNNQLNEVRRDLFYHNIYPDLADARGNTGVHFAVTGDCHEIIKQLANVGANLDALNDECLTPLLLSILRYIATLNKVVFWDKAFLSEIILNSRELDQVTQWRPHESLVSLRDVLGSSAHLPQIHRSFTDGVKKGTEDMSAKIRSRLLSSKSNSVAMKINLIYLFSTSFIDDYEKYKRAIASKKVEDVEEKDVETIAQTIEVLLHYGADPNIGDLPMQPLLLSIYTKNLNLIETLLQHDANSDCVTEENLTGLHILSTLPFSSENVQIAEKFLKYSSDPNRKSGIDLWLEQNEELIGNYISPLAENDDYEGKTPLQMIAMRKDFDEENVTYQCDLVRTLIEYGALYDQYYLGHTLLSLAVLRGNSKLIETLHRYVEFGQSLGENMGNCLTILGLCRFPFLRSFSYCKSTIDDLITLGMNPFNPVYDFSNVYEFFLDEYSHDVDFDIPRIRANLEAEDASFRKAIYSSNLTINKNCNKLSVAYIKEIGRNILTRLCQYKTIQILLCFAAQDLLYHKCLENMAKFFSIPEALDCLKVFINQNKIKMDSDYQKIVFKLLNFIRVNTSKITKKTPPKYEPIATESALVLEDEVLKLSEKFQVPNYIAMYALDSNPEKYEVCFHCMRKSGKTLLCCPCCGSVKFCSELCNKYSNKSDTKHFCNLLFYNENKGDDEKPIDNLPLTGIDLLMHEAKQTRNEERLAELIRRQAEEEEKSMKQLRKSQKMDSQLSLHERKSQSKTHIGKSASVSFVSEPESKKKVCCRKPSAIFVCDEMAQLQPRKLNCGFHCGQVIPEVHLDDEGNIVREQEFCECYPLYKEDEELSKSKDQIYPTAKSEDDMLTAHYSLSEIFGGALSGEETKVKEAEELDTLMETFARDEKRKSVISERIKLDDDITDIEKINDQDLPETHEQKHKNLSGGDVDIHKIEKTKRVAKHPESVEETTADEESKKPRKGRANEEGKKGKEKKIESDTEINRRKKENKRKEKSRTSTLQKKKKGKVDGKKSKPESEYLSTKKKTETRSESTIVTGRKKTKKTGKEEKGIGDSSKHDKKTMTKKLKSKKGEGREAGIQVDISFHKSTSTSKKKKGYKEKSNKSAEGTIKQIDRKKRANKKTEEIEKKAFKNQKKEKKIVKSKKSEKISRKEIATKEVKQEKLHQVKHRTDEKSESMLYDHADKSNRDATIGKTLASMRALDAKLLHPEKILALSGGNYEQFQRISRVYQYFLELIANYFPDFDLSCLMLPFACFLDGQLYYKFSDTLPYYCRTYSSV